MVLLVRSDDRSIQSVVLHTYLDTCYHLHGVSNGIHPLHLLSFTVHRKVINPLWCLREGGRCETLSAVE